MAFPRLASILVGSKLAVATRLVRILYVLVWLTTLAVSAYHIYGSVAVLWRVGPEVTDILAKGRRSEYWKDVCGAGDPAPVCAAENAGLRLRRIDRRWNR